MSQTAFICGASRGIGHALLVKLLESNSYKTVMATYRSSTPETPLASLLKKYPDQLRLIKLDMNESSDYAALTGQVSNCTQQIDLCINTVGILSDQNLQPERSLSEISLDKAMRSFSTNTMGSLLLAQALSQFLIQSANPIFAVLSAKVGSIEDNKTGGWYSYRMSKAALNMGLKNLSIELKRSNPRVAVVAVHPGTTETDLSQPFLKFARNKYKIHTAEETARNILNVLSRPDSSSMNGKFFSWNGEELPW